MNKMAKGALATGVGVALLLGGGGTLATWNATANASAGTIAAGELKMTAGTGSWASNMTAGAIRVADYKMVPGEKLTYSQDLAVTLVGDRITANLKTTDAVAKAFGNEANITMEYSTNNGTSWTPATSGVTATPLQLAAGVQTVKARLVVDFTNMSSNTTASMTQTQALSGVGFKLEQNVPTATTATQAPAPVAP
jgi:alternate signal-mediated exported protein